MTFPEFRIISLRKSKTVYQFFCSYLEDKTKVAVLQFMGILQCMLLDKLQCTVTRHQCMAPGHPCTEIRHQCMTVRFSTRINFKQFFSPLDTGRKLNVHKTFRRLPRRLNVLGTFSLRPVSRGLLWELWDWKPFRAIISELPWSELHSFAIHLKDAFTLF